MATWTEITEHMTPANIRPAMDLMLKEPVTFGAALMDRFGHSDGVRQLMAEAATLKRSGQQAAASACVGMLGAIYAADEINRLLTDRQAQADPPPAIAEPTPPPAPPKSLQEEDERESVEDASDPGRLPETLSDMGLSGRAVGALALNDVTTLGELLARDVATLSRMPKVGAKVMAEIHLVLGKHGYQLEE